MIDMHDIYHIDKARVRASFDHAAKTYDASAILQKEVRARMMQRLDLVSLKPDLMLDAGCGTGHAGKMLQRRFKGSQLISLDIAPAMLQQTQSHLSLLSRIFGNKPAAVCADIEHLPIVDSSLDLFWSNLAIQWCNDLDLVFNEASRVLKPEGLLMFSTFGPDTLRELREATSTDNEHVHVSRFIDMHDIGDALVRAGFSAPVLDVERFVLTYDDVTAIMRDLKAIGAHNAASGRQRGLYGRGFLQKLTANYERYRQAGKLPATYEVVYGHAWKGAPRKSRGDGESTVSFHPRRAS